MKQLPWRYALASVAGTSHGRTGQPCQDASECHVLLSEEGKEVLVAVVADGAGSACKGGDGAEIACRMFVQEMRDLVEVGSNVPDVTDEFARKWLETFQREINRRAEVENLTPRDYACTFLAAVVGEKHSVYLQIGDGVIVVALSEFLGTYNWVFWPQRGEYENMTTFATDPGAAQHLMYRFDDWPVEEVALLTDGLQRLALHYETNTAHAPFFAPMFAPLTMAPSGRSEQLSRSLATFLDSQAVNTRTDDDKTLVLAFRRPPAVFPIEITEEAMSGDATL